MELSWGEGNLTLRNSMFGTSKAPKSCRLGSRQPFQCFLHAMCLGYCPQLEKGCARMGCHSCVSSCMEPEILSWKMRAL